jgi:ribonuclease HI
MAKKHFYAVVKGRKPGLYTRWSGVGGAEEQVKGYPGAVYQGFGDRPEAELFLRSGGQQPSAPGLPLGIESAQAESEITGEREAPAARSPGASRIWKEAYREDLAAGKVVVFTDGASTGNPGPGGYGVVLLYGEARKELSGGFRCTTNNRMELLACIVALRELKRHAPVVLYSDSRYVVHAVEQGWALRWRNNGWMRAPGEHGQFQQAENVDLWEQMLDLLDRNPVEFRWVKGHARHPENERCDRLAVQASHGQDLPPDPGYRGRCRGRR